MSIDDLVAEAQRQLTVCNACRYCEGYCAVFPALERRNLLGDGDVTQLANLCHDCRACFHACMYAPPHDFELNPPAVLAEVRLAGYEKYIPRLPMGRRAFGLVLGVAVLLVLGLVVWTGSLVPSNGSPYAVLPFAVLLPLMLIPCVWSVVVVLRGGARYWRDVHGRLRDLADPAALWQATRYAATLRYLRGGGDDCYYPSAEPSPVRRNLHAATFYGFLACFASTISAGIMEHFIGLLPPYPLYSVPVVLGVLGGLGLVVGCTGLIMVKLRSDRVPADPAMIARDYGLLLALDALGATGLLTTLLRDTLAFGPVLVVHLITVAACFAAAPYSKFVHFQYRFLALVKDGIEKRRH
jgi:citrate/tricarballylate utilization protein